MSLYFFISSRGSCLSVNAIELIHYFCVTQLNILYLYIVWFPIRGAEQWYHKKSVLTTIEVITTTAFTPLTATFMMLNLCKFYLYYFDHSYERVLASEKWAIFIDPSITTNNWYLQNKHKWGNQIWLMKWIVLPITIVYGILFAALDQLLIHFNAPTQYYEILLLFLNLHVLVMAGFFWRLYPRFNDSLGIKNEIKFIIMVEIVFSITMCISGFLSIFVYPPFEMMGGLITILISCWYSWCLIIYPQKINAFQQYMLRRGSMQRRDSERVGWKEVNFCMF